MTRRAQGALVALAALWLASCAQIPDTSRQVTLPQAPKATEASTAVQKEHARILAAYGAGSGHVFNLGHGITPEVDPAHAGAFFEAVHELSAQYHQ